MFRTEKVKREFPPRITPAFRVSLGQVTALLEVHSSQHSFFDMRGIQGKGTENSKVLASSHTIWSTIFSRLTNKGSSVSKRETSKRDGDFPTVRG
jgi:hypothetical protein